MNEYLKPVEIRWSDLDPNFHLRHSAYYDFGAYCRISFLNEHGCTPAILANHQLGAILFREECMFRREILFSDTVTINLKLTKFTPNYSRWTIVHEIIKNGNTVSAIITVDGAWIDTSKRKLTTPPPFVVESFINMPREEEVVKEEKVD
jgi:acyl-CoA thioester hydrolase